VVLAPFHLSLVAFEVDFLLALVFEWGRIRVMGIAVATIGEYKQYAKECLRWAAESKTEDDRKAFLELARAWTLAAMRLEEFSTGAPVVSISLGDEAEFIVGGLTRKAPTYSYRLRSGDIVWFGGPGRMIYHGVARTFLGTSSLFREHGFDGGRINVTLRRIDARKH
jgi:hypothetical protein